MGISWAKENKFGIRGAKFENWNISQKKGGKFGISWGKLKNIGIIGHNTISLA